MHRVRIFISESYWTDTTVPGDSWMVAQALGTAMSPINKAIYLGAA